MGLSIQTHAGSGITDLNEDLGVCCIDRHRSGQCWEVLNGLDLNRQSASVGHSISCIDDQLKKNGFQAFSIHLGVGHLLIHLNDQLDMVGKRLTIILCRWANTAWTDQMCPTCRLSHSSAMS